jgi:hypothetical protein
MNEKLEKTSDGEKQQLILDNPTNASLKESSLIELMKEKSNSFKDVIA